MEKSFLRRTVRPVPEMDTPGLLRIARGVAFEDFVTRETRKPVVKDGIICTIDDEACGNIIEIKATIKSAGKFHPLKTYPWWAERMKGYCYAYGVNEIVLNVFHFVWYRGSEERIRSYRIKFTDEELEENWKEKLRRAEIFRACLKFGAHVPPHEIHPHKFGGGRSECDNCEWKERCYWIQSNQGEK